MTHLGDICKINGAEIEPVDVITGGSPCQDLSVAGKRAGLQGERSGLFMEQMRIIKEMRQATNGVYPRIMVWENVPGAFSSNKGEDFRAVLEETAKIADETAVIPRPDKGKWTTAGCIMGDQWSIAWRVLDAQFWGVPQRRRRIALVADFGGQSAPEILFERNSVSGDIAESGAARERVTRGVEGGIGETIGWYQNGCGECFVDDKAKTIQTNSNPSGRGVQMLVESKSYGFDSYNQVTYDEQSQTLKAHEGGDSTAKVMTIRMREGKDGGGKGPLIQVDKSGTLGTGNDQTIIAAPEIKGTPGVCYTLNTIDRPAVFSFDSLSSNSMKSSNPHSGCRQVEVAKCIDTTNPDPSKNQGGMAVVCMNPEEVQSKRVFDKDGIAPTISGAEGGGKCCVNVIQPSIYDARGNGDGSIAPTMAGDHQNRVTDYTGIVTYQNTTGPLMANSHPGSYSGQDAYTDMFVAAVDCRNGTENPDINGTLQAKSTGGMSLNLQNTVRQYQTVRRLTPLEAERLQGYEDGWTNIPPQTKVTAEDLSFWRKVWDEWDDMQGVKHHSDKQIIKWLRSEPADSARYKALGNSIALPPWRFVLSRIRQTGSKTLGSLFDGIGGFPLIWQELGGQAVWASEIEPFPIAVTKARIG